MDRRMDGLTDGWTDQRDRQTDRDRQTSTQTETGTVAAKIIFTKIKCKGDANGTEFNERNTCMQKTKSKGVSRDVQLKSRTQILGYSVLQMAEAH